MVPTSIIQAPLAEQVEQVHDPGVYIYIYFQIRISMVVEKEQNKIFFKKVKNQPPKLGEVK